MCENETEKSTVIEKYSTIDFHQGVFHCAQVEFKKLNVMRLLQT